MSQIDDIRKRHEIGETLAACSWEDDEERGMCRWYQHDVGILLNEVDRLQSKNAQQRAVVKLLQQANADLRGDKPTMLGGTYIGMVTHDREVDALKAEITALQAENAALQGNLDEVAMLLKARLWDLEHIEREVNAGGLVPTTEKAERILSLVFCAEAEAALEKEGSDGVD